MAYAAIWTVALLASGLTFFSGFGLGTLLLPAFAVFFPIQVAVALTAVVHFLNGVFKLFLVWHHVNWTVLFRFGIPAIVGALIGSLLLLEMAGSPALYSYQAFGRSFSVEPAKFVIGVLLLCFAAAEASPALRKIAFPPRYFPIGGLLSGFFGGLAGMQGALRSAFLVKGGLTKEQYVATGAAIAFCIDVSRLAVYTRLIAEHSARFDFVLLGGAVVAALLGSVLGNRYLAKATMPGIQLLVAILLFAVAAGLIAGLL